MTIETGKALAEKQTYTVSEFMELDLPDDGKQYELIEGELIEMSGPNVQHGLIISHLFHYLDSFLASNQLGRVLNNAAFELNSKNSPIPDLAFISAKRLIGLDFTKPFPGAPDLAIEVMSPSDKWSDVSKKVQLYREAGAKLVWVIDPFDQGVTVHRYDAPRRLLLINDELDGEDVVPGFKLKISALFE